MSVQIILTAFNRSGTNPKTGRPYTDATGAFIPEAQAFQKIHGGNVSAETHPIDAKARRDFSENAIRSCAGMKVLAIFGHGSYNTYPATGHKMAHVSAFCDAVKAVSGSSDIDLVFYSCLTGRDYKGFANAVAALLPNARVWAHTTAAHTTKNPETVLALPTGGIPIAPAGDPLRKQWYAKMQGFTGENKKGKPTGDDPTYRLTFWTAAKGLHGAKAVEAVRKTIAAGLDPNIIRAPSAQDAAYFQKLMLAAKETRETAEARASGSLILSRVDSNISAINQSNLGKLERSQSDAVTWQRSNMTTFKSALSTTVPTVNGQQAQSSDMW